MADKEINLSDQLDDAIQFETYGLFMSPVTKYDLSDFVTPVLQWMRNEDFVDHDRQTICHNVQQIDQQ